MPHIAITMIPGRDNDTKAALAQKMRDCLIQELHVDPKFVSVSVEDIEPEQWTASMERIPTHTMFIRPT